MKVFGKWNCLISYVILCPFTQGDNQWKNNTSTKQTSLPQLQKTPTNGSTVFEWLSKSVNKSTLCMKMKMIVVTHAYCSTTHRFCTCRFSSHCAALCIDQARRTPTGLHGDHYWPCVLCTAASCSFCRAAETRTRPCSSRWSVQRSRAPVGGESGWDMCTAPGWHIREGGNTGVEFYSLFDLSLTWRTRESVCMLTNLEIWRSLGCGGVISKAVLHHFICYRRLCSLLFWSIRSLTFFF